MFIVKRQGIITAKLDKKLIKKWSDSTYPNELYIDKIKVKSRKKWKETLRLFETIIRSEYDYCEIIKIGDTH